MTSRVRLSRYAYAGTAWLMVLGIMMQVFFIGLSLLGQRPSWQSHIGLGHALGVLPLLLIILAYVGRLPRPMKPVTWLVFAIYILLADIVIFMRGSVPLVAALHPVLALLLFAFALFLAYKGTSIARTGSRITTETAAHTAVPAQPIPEAMGN